jgi:AcrR family transcriptional regulator
VSVRARAPKSDVAVAAAPRRRYESPLRRQQAAETRERIVAAGAELLHSVPIWNWGALTVRAVAARAGTTERTVYRYFANERELRDAVLHRLEEEAGVDLEGLRLGDIRDVTARVLAYASSFPLVPRTPRDPTVAAANERQREALLAALGPWTNDWEDVDREIAAAVLDVLWSPMSYERLVTDWGLGAEEGIAGITWVIGLVEEAIGAGNRPGGGRGRAGAGGARLAAGRARGRGGADARARGRAARPVPRSAG